MEINSNFHVGKPDNLNDGLELFKKDIGDYEGMWNESDFDWRINNGDIFSYITKDDRIIAWLWLGQKIYKTWELIHLLLKIWLVCLNHMLPLS